ncbi:MAG: hypothetical protein OEX22_10930 [Cyclobacteriaceae bacterium]|nr:hypothetical protein [Cyclobacteriaceae bacterium]
MNKPFGIICVLVFFLTNSYSQNNIYYSSNVGVVWNSYANSNPHITGNEDVGNIFWDNDFIIGVLVGCEFRNNLILESGAQYHNAMNRYFLNFTDLKRGSSNISLGEGFLDIPLNIKYKINSGIEKLNIVPYLGVTISNHTINTNPYYTIYDIEYEGNLPPINLVPVDTISIVNAYRPLKTSILINGGIGFEYTFFKRMTFTLSGNFTTGFNDMNKLTVVVFRENQTEYGEIIYQGTKFYLATSIKILLRSKERIINGLQHQ